MPNLDNLTLPELLELCKVTRPEIEKLCATIDQARAWIEEIKQDDLNARMKPEE